MLRRFVAPAVAAFVAWPVGCQPAGPRYYDVSGTVTFEGKPVPDGDILFVPNNAAYGADAGKIKDGAFAFRAKEGKCRVEVRAARPVPGKLAPDGYPYTEVYIPARYNDKSTLSADVPSADGSTRYEFKLDK